MDDNAEFEIWWKTIGQTIGRVAAQAAWDKQQERIEKLIEENQILKDYLKPEINEYTHSHPAYLCKFCGSPSWYEPIDQIPPMDYCHESDHGYPPCTEENI